jgi:hypothetical protein
VATDEGLAWSSLRKPGLFHYVRGADYALKDRQLWRPPHHVPAAPAADLLLPGDHITCLAQDSRGKLWLGTWRSGCWTGIFRVNKSKGSMPEVLPVSRHGGSLFSSSYITAILPRSDGKTLIGHYGTGVSAVRISKPSWWSKLFHYVLGGFHDVLAWLFWRANLPAPAQAPTTRQLAALTAKLLAHRPSARSTGPRVVPITSDWRTQGTWLGRYGRSWACLFACKLIPPDYGLDYVWAPGSLVLDHVDGIGPHHRQIQLHHGKGDTHLRNGDTVRYWIQWLFTAKKRVLELPEVYLDRRVVKHLTTWAMDRRESEIDDNGESYPVTWQGPDLCVFLHIPPGEYTLSLYFFNKDGHSGSNRNRDYAISMIPLPATYLFGSDLFPNTAPLAKMRGAVQSRVVNFWGGVWKRFLVRGPMKLAVRVARNYSLDACLAGAMLDPLAEHPAPYYFGHRAWQAHEKQRAELRTSLAAAWHNIHDSPMRQRRASDVTGGQTGSIHAAWLILQILNVLEHRNPAAWAANQRQAYLSVLRWCVANYGKLPKNLAAAAITEKCYYHLGLFHHWEAVEKSRHILTSRQIEKGLRPNGWPYSYRGHEFGVIRRYLRKLKIASKRPHLKTGKEILF